MTRLEISYLALACQEHKCLSHHIIAVKCIDLHSMFILVKEVCET